MLREKHSESGKKEKTQKTTFLDIIFYQLTIFWLFVEFDEQHLLVIALVPVGCKSTTLADVQARLTTFKQFRFLQNPYYITIHTKKACDCSKSKKCSVLSQQTIFSFKMLDLVFFQKSCQSRYNYGGCAYPQKNKFVYQS